MCKICGNDKCIGKYLLHPMELCKIPEIKEMSEAIYAMAIVQAIKTMLSGILGLE